MNKEEKKMKKKIITGQLIILLICWAIGIPLFLKGMEKTNYTEKDVEGQWSTSNKKAVEEAQDSGWNMAIAGGGLFLFGGMQFVFFHTLSKEKAKKAKQQAETSNLENIAKLKELFDSGAITKEEFEKKKEELLKSVK